jgi:Flp pilus assembly protein TadD
LLAQGDYRSVIGLLQSAPADEALALDLAEAYDKIGAQDEAVKTLSDALERSPSSLDLSRELVVLLIAQNHFEDGTRIAKQAVQQHPGNPEAEKLYLHVLVNDDVEHATPLAKKLLASFPHDFEVLYLNGVLEREAGEYEIARKHLEEAVSLNPNHYNSQYNLGMVLAELKDPQGARRHLEKAIALGATEPQIRFKLAAVLRTLGETKLAQQQLELYQQEQQARQNRTLVATRSAAAANELASGDPKKAVALYREAVALSPKDAMLEYKLSVALDKTGDTEGERAALEQVVQLDPDFALAHNQLGYLASRSGDHASAEEHFRQAVRAAPAFLQAWVSLAATLGMESRFSEAQDAVGTALRIDPKNEEALHLREELTAAAQARQ